MCIFMLSTCEATQSLNRFIKTLFWNFQKCKADLCYILIDKQMIGVVKGVRGVKGVLLKYIAILPCKIGGL